MLHCECPVCQPNLYCSAVFSAEFCSFRKNSANPNINCYTCVDRDTEYCTLDRLRACVDSCNTSTGWSKKADTRSIFAITSANEYQF